jgi:hypothetical protein
MADWLIISMLNALKAIGCFHPGAFADQEQSMTGVVKRDGVACSSSLESRDGKPTCEVAGMVADEELFLCYTKENSKFGGSTADTICDTANCSCGIGC